jgi:hypothetical protein
VNCEVAFDTDGTVIDRGDFCHLPDRITATFLDRSG